MRYPPVFAAILMLLLTACDQVLEETSPLGQLSSAFGPQEYDAEFIKLLRAKAPALQLGVIDTKTSSVLLLQARRNGVETWLSPDGASIILDRGMLVGTRGLGGGLMASDVTQPQAMLLRGQGGWSDRFMTFLNGEDRTVIRTYRCLIEVQGPREVNLGKRKVGTVLLKEDCRSLDQSFFNLYWVDQSRDRIVQSRQWAGDFVGPLSTRLVEN